MDYIYSLCTMSIRSVDRILYAVEKSSRTGSRQRTVIGNSQLNDFDPFLILDHGKFQPPAGFPDHPHRGFETATYMLNGTFKHEDFIGNKGTLKVGDLQWMTAGRGMVHSEVPGSTDGGELLQLWINLSKEFKLIAPAYQDIHKKDIPIAKQKGVTVAVVAGECLGVKSKVYTRTPTMYLDITLDSNAGLLQPVPLTWNSLLYILEGKVSVGSNEHQTDIQTNQYATFKQDGECISLQNRSNEPSRIILIAGQPLNEPIVKHGPFVMNNQDEITQAISDYRNCLNGFEPAAKWKSVHLKKLES